jgi:hypothetical protein
MKLLIMQYRSTMESNYSFIELADMHLVLGEFNRNVKDAVIIYRETYLI